MGNDKPTCGHNLWSFSPGTCPGCRQAQKDFNESMKGVDFSLLKDPEFTKKLQDKFNSPEYKAELEARLRPFRQQPLDQENLIKRKRAHFLKRKNNNG